MLLDSSPFNNSESRKTFFALPRGEISCYFILSAIIFIGIILRVFNIENSSLWIDEGFSVQVATSGMEKFIALVLSDVHPPLYYGILLIWSMIFGYGEPSLRMLSVVFGVLTIPLIFFIGRNISGNLVGLISAGLLATSPLHIQYSTEVRMYSLLMLNISIATWGATRFAVDPSNKLALTRGSSGFAVGVILCAATQATGLTILPALSLLMIVGWLSAGRPRQAVKPFLVSHLVIGVMLGAWLPFLAWLAGNAADLAAWIPKPTIRVIADVVGSLLAQKLSDLLPLPIAAIAATLVAMLALMGTWIVRRDPVGLWFAILVGALPFTITILFSLVAQPVFLTRVHLWSLLPIYVMVAVTMVRTPWRSARWGGATAMTLIVMSGLYAYHFAWSRQDWRSAALRIEQEIVTGDIVLVHNVPGVTAVIGYYAPQAAAAVSPVTADAAALQEVARNRRVWHLAARWLDRVPEGVVAEALRANHTFLAGFDYHLIRLTVWQPTFSAGPETTIGTPPPNTGRM